MQYEIRPLRKRHKNGALYAHTTATTEALKQIVGLDEQALVARCKVHHKDRADFIPNACLMYLLRTTQGGDQFKGALIEAVLTRITQIVRRQVSTLPEHYANDIKDKVVGDFLDLVITDRQQYDENLDSHERYFRKTVMLDCIDAFRALRRRDKRQRGIEPADPEAPLAKEIRKAITEASDADFVRAQDQARVAEAISHLEPFHGQILKFHLMGYPIHSQNGAPCMTKFLKRSEKTINKNYAIAWTELRQVLQEGNP